MVTNRDRKPFGSGRKNSKFCSNYWHRWLLDLRWGISGPTTRRASACPNYHEWWTKPAHWDAQLLSYLFRRNWAVYEDYLVNLTNNLRGGYCFGSSRTRRNRNGKITTFKLGHPVFDVGIEMMHVHPVFFQSGVNFLRDMLCLAGGGGDLMTARVSLLLKSRASPDKLPFRLCNKKRLAIRHMNRPLFSKTLSIPSYESVK